VRVRVCVWARLCGFENCFLLLHVSSNSV